MASTPSSVPLIRRAPRAFSGMARKHNELARAVRPLLNLSAGSGISITKAAGNIMIATK